MLARVFLALLLLLGSAQANAFTPDYQATPAFEVDYTAPIASSTPAYVGPGDIVASATAWYGLRAYSAAVAATGTQKSVNIRRASDNTTQDIGILTTGALDVAGYNTFVGTDATCTGSMVGTTTLTISGCASGTIHVNDPISGAGIVQPAYVTVIGTCGAGAGTCTLNAAQTFASETVTAQVAGFVTKAYDQASGTHDASQATAGNQPQLLPLCANSGTLPCMFGSGKWLSGTISATNQPFTLSNVSYSMGVTEGWSFATYNAGGSGILGYNNGGSAGTGRLYCGSDLTPALTNLAWHSLVGVCNGASSAYVIDGAATTGNAGATATSTGIGVFGEASDGSINFAGFMTEDGLWPVAFNATQYGNTRANQSAYWGTP